MLIPKSSITYNKYLLLLLQSTYTILPSGNIRDKFPTKRGPKDRVSATRVKRASEERTRKKKSIHSLVKTSLSLTSMNNVLNRK